MCGIAGYIGKKTIGQTEILSTLDRMKRRGPDAQRYYVTHDGDTSVTLLHSRLSIIDLDERSHQPFTIDDYTIVFNGEIYNYVELRKRLEERGVTFQTASDTEVLLQSYIAYGQACVEHFEGMWSFAIYDKRAGTLFLSRDRFGEKPLYLLPDAGGVYFASEITFLTSLASRELTVNTQHLLRYLVNGYKSLYKQNEHFFAEIEEVPRAANMVITREGEIRKSMYWVPHVQRREMPIDEAIEGFRTRLIESVKLRLRADVPLAFCLSGGVDSASLVSIAAKQFGYDVSTFSIIDHDERYNERENIQATIDDIGCRSTFIEFPKPGFFERLEQLIRYHGAPIATTSYYVHSFLSEAISQQGYRIAISGTAADELVTGYYDHFNLHLYEVHNRSEYQKALDDWKTYIAPIVRNPFLQDPELYVKDQNIRDHIYLNNDVFAGYLKAPFQETFIEEVYCDSLLRNRMLNELFHEVVPPILHEDDLNSMYYSIENRSPYLDSHLFDFACSIPNEYLIRDGFGKYILREAMAGILNDRVRLDRQKKGFNASIQSLVDLKSKEVQEYIVSDGKIFDFVDREKIMAPLQMDPLPNSYSKFLFNFINAKMFLEIYG